MTNPIKTVTRLIRSLVYRRKLNRPGYAERNAELDPAYTPPKIANIIGWKGVGKKGGS